MFTQVVKLHAFAWYLKVHYCVPRALLKLQMGYNYTLTNRTGKLAVRGSVYEETSF
jgi:hypothetical protein